MEENPFLARKQKNQCRGRKAESKAAARLGATVHAGSGAIAGYKGDLTKDAFLLESKSTVAKSLRVELHWLRKITKEARDVNQYPALLMQFTDDEANPVPEGAWVAVPEYIWNLLVQENPEV